jgi:hypothetical protein
MEIHSDFHRAGVLKTFSTLENAINFVFQMFRGYPDMGWHITEVSDDGFPKLVATIMNFKNTHFLVCKDGMCEKWQIMGQDGGVAKRKEMK